jgi:hypothetical protein
MISRRKKACRRVSAAARKVLYGAPMSTKQDTQRAIDILAKSVYRDLKQNGYSRADMVAFASNILEQITSEAKATQSASASIPPAQ